MVQDINSDDPFGSMNIMSDEMLCDFFERTGEGTQVCMRCWCDRTPVVWGDFQKNGRGMGSFPIENLNGDRQRQSYADSQGSTTDAKNIIV
jgi:hypothetical protein